MGKKVNYSFSLITYLDILGFRDLIQHRTPGEISRVVRILKEKTKPDEQVAKIHGMKFFNFSDTAVRITPVYTPLNIKNPFGYLYWEILSLVHIQHELIRQGIIVRGALSAGDIVKSWGVMYGPGLVQAYELEKEACYPRIIIDELLFKELKINSSLRAHEYKEELGYISSLVRKDTDGYRFVDYLRAIADEMDYPEQDYPHFLRKHADLIAEGLLRHRLEKKVLRKFKWLQKYHNDTIDVVYGKLGRKDLRV